MKKDGKALKSLRIILDVIMILLAATMFSRRAISQTYHEIAGFALIALFIVHLILNHKWLKVFTAKWDVSPARVKIMALLDALVAVAWVAVAVTSVLVSEEIFSFKKVELHSWHKFCSALALLLTGLHFGMHWGGIQRALGKASTPIKAIAAVLLIALLGFGCYNLSASSYVRWLSAPFSAQGTRGGGSRGFGRRGGGFGEGEGRMSWGRGSGEWDGRMPWGRDSDGDDEQRPRHRRFRGEDGEATPENAPEGESENAPRNNATGENEKPLDSEVENAPTEKNDAETPESAPDREDNPHGPSREDGEEGEHHRRRGGDRGEDTGDDEEGGRRHRSGRGPSRDGEDGERGDSNKENSRGSGREREQKGFSVGRMLKTLATGLSEIFLFAALAYSVECLFGGKKDLQEVMKETEETEDPKDDEE